MTAKTPEHAATPAARTSIVGRVRSLCAKAVSPVWSRIAPRPLWQKLVLGTVLAAVIGAGGWLTLSKSEKQAEQPALAMSDALHWLHEQDFEEARNIALHLKQEGKLSYNDRGGPAYILGMVAAHEASLVPYPDEQQRLYLIAARYLDTAHHDDYPASLSTDGLVQLGEAWYQAGRYARALPYLTQALKRRPRRTARVHQLLAASYYRDTNPQLKPALEHLDKYLADRMLTPVERHAGLVEQARILIDLGRAAEAEASLAKIPAPSELAAVVNVLRARLVMQQADQLAKNPATAAEADALWNKAMELLRTPSQPNPANAQAQREAQYLLGLCFVKLQDFRAAENQLSRTRRLNMGLPEGRAATLEEADLQRLQGKDEAAIELYTELLSELGDLRDYSNPWLPIDVLRERLLTAYRHYRDAGKFEVALRFVDTLTPLIPRPRVLELQAEVNRYWGDQLATQAGDGDGDKAAALQRLSRVRYHTAAETYYALARLTRDTREYPERLWTSADCYRLAHDFHRTSRVMRMYLDENQRQRRVDALLAIGEAELALNNLEAALVALQELLRDDGKHPLSYRARLVAYQVLVEQHKYAEARQILTENLEHEALTPQSLEWRDSLFSLAQLLYRQGLELEASSRAQGVDGEDEEARKTGLRSLEQAAAMFHEAILKFEESLTRYPDAPQAFEARYLLADCYRQAAKWPRKKMPDISIEITRAALTRQMREELQAAERGYSQLIAALSARQDQQPLTARQRELLRNSYFLQADTLFDLGDYAAAIEAYSNASNRYQQQPEALEAFVQIASCYRQLDEPAKARGTLEQAKVVLRRMPADVDFDRTTRYSRDEWVALLDLLSSM